MNFAGNMPAKKQKRSEIKGSLERCTVEGKAALRFTPDRRSPNRFHLFYEVDFLPKKLKQFLRDEHSN